MSQASLAVVTGFSRGVGRAVALALSARGQRLALLGRASPAARHVAALCRASGAPEVHEFDVDFADLVAVERVAARVSAELGAPDCVIHNAGIVERQPVEALAVESWQAQLTINLSAPFVLTRAWLPALRARGSGRVLFVGSISSTLGSARHSAYAASKWGLVGFMKSLAEELTDSGVMTAAVLPGSIDTDMLEGSGFPPRMSAADVAQSLVFLALDAPLAHNGAVLEMFGV